MLAASGVRCAGRPEPVYVPPPAAAARLREHTPQHQDRLPVALRRNPRVTMRARGCRSDRLRRFTGGPGSPPTPAGESWRGVSESAKVSAPIKMANGTSVSGVAYRPCHSLGPPRCSIIAYIDATRRPRLSEAGRRHAPFNKHEQFAEVSRARRPPLALQPFDRHHHGCSRPMFTMDCGETGAGASLGVTTCRSR